MIDDCEQDSIAFMVTIAWSIWGSRNEVRLSHRMEHLDGRKSLFFGTSSSS